MEFIDRAIDNYLGDNNVEGNPLSTDQIVSNLFRQSFGRKPPKNKLYLNNLNFHNIKKVPFYVPKKEDQIVTDEDFFKYILHNPDNLFDDVDDVTKDDKKSFFRSKLNPTDVGSDYSNVSYLLKGIKRKKLPSNYFFTENNIDNWMRKKMKTDPNNPQVQNFDTTNKTTNKINKDVNNDTASKLYQDPHLMRSLNLFKNLRQKDETFDDRILTSLKNEVENIKTNVNETDSIENLDLPDIPELPEIENINLPNAFRHNQGVSKIDILKNELQNLFPNQKDQEPFIPNLEPDSSNVSSLPPPSLNLSHITSIDNKNQPFESNVSIKENKTSKQENVNEIEEQAFASLIDQKDGTFKIDALDIPIPVVDQREPIVDSFTNLYPGISLKPFTETIHKEPENEIQNQKLDVEDLIKLIDNIIGSNPFPISENIKKFLQSLFYPEKFYQKLLESRYYLESIFGTILFNKNQTDGNRLADFVYLLTDPSNVLEKHYITYDRADENEFFEEYEKLAGKENAKSFRYWKFFTAFYNSQVSTEKRVIFRNKLKTALDDVKNVEMLNDSDKQTRQILRQHYQIIKKDMPHLVQKNIDKFIHFLCSVDSPISPKILSDEYKITINSTNGEIFYDFMPTSETLLDFVYDNSKEFAEDIPFIYSFYGDIESYNEYVDQQLDDLNLTREDVEFDKSYYWKYLCSLYNSFVSTQQKVVFKHSVTKSKEHDYITLYKADPNSFLKTIIYKNFDLSTSELNANIEEDSINSKFRKSLLNLKNKYKKVLSDCFSEYGRFLNSLSEPVFKSHFGSYDMFYDSNIYFGYDLNLSQNLPVIKIIQEFIRNNRIFPDGKIKQLTNSVHPYKTVDKFSFIQDFTDNFENDFSFISTCFYFLPTFLSYLPYISDSNKQNQLNDSINQAIVELHKNLEYDSIRTNIISIEQLENFLLSVRKIIFDNPTLLDDDVKKIEQIDSDDSDDKNNEQTRIQKLIDELTDSTTVERYKMYFGSEYSEEINEKMSLYLPKSETSEMSLIADIPKSTVSMYSISSKNSKMSVEDLAAVAVTNVKKKELLKDDFKKINNGEFYSKLYDDILHISEQIIDLYIDKQFNSANDCDKALQDLHDLFTSAHYLLEEFENSNFETLHHSVSTFLTEHKQKAYDYIQDYKSSILLQELHKNQNEEYENIFYANPDNQYVSSGIPNNEVVNISMSSESNSLMELIKYESDVGNILDEVKRSIKSEIMISDTDLSYDNEPQSIFKWKDDLLDENTPKIDLTLNRENLEKLPKEEYKEKLKLWLENEKEYENSIDFSISSEILENFDTVLIKTAKKAYIESMNAIMKKIHIVSEKVKAYKGEMKNELMQLAEQMFIQVTEFKDNAFFLVKSSFKRPSVLQDYANIYETAYISINNLHLKISQIDSQNQFLLDALSSIENMKYDLKNTQLQLQKLIEQYKINDIYGEVKLENQYDVNVIENVPQGMTLKNELNNAHNENLINSNLSGPVDEEREKINKKWTDKLVSKVEILDDDEDDMVLNVTDTYIMRGNVFYSTFSFDKQKFSDNLSYNKNILIAMNEGGMLEFILKEYLEFLLYFHTKIKVNWLPEDIVDTKYDSSKSLLFNRLSFIFKKLLQMKSTKIWNIDVWINKINNGFINLDRVFVNSLSEDTKVEPLENVLDFQKSII